MKEPLIILIILLLQLSIIIAQPNKKGEIEIIKDPRIDSLVKKHIDINSLQYGIHGYRIQIYFGANRAKALEVKSEFLKIYPDIAAYLIYQQPNFKIRVGDFRTRLEAYKFYRSLLLYFNLAFIVRDDIKLPDFN